MTAQQERDDAVDAAPAALVVGETLIDVVERSGAVAEFVGGSPANVAVGIARRGYPVRLLTRLGRDARGERAASRFAEEDVQLLPVSWDAEPTSVARARIAADGSADYRLSVRWSLPDHAPEPVALVHAGSLALFLEPGGTRVVELLRAAGRDVLVTLDPNIRPALLGDREAALRRFEEAAERADLVKLSDEDADWLYPGLGPEAAAGRVRALGPRIVVVTCGAQGAVAVGGAETPGAETPDAEPLRVPAHPAEVVDTVGAGDAFMASLACSLLHRGIDGVQRELPAVLDRAARAAAITVSVAGPHPPRGAAPDG